jgi:protein TonB
MKQQKRKTSAQSAWVTTTIVVTVLMGLAGGLVYLVSTDKGGGQKKVFIARVDLVKPDASPKEPPPPKEKPLEQEAKKTEPIMAPQSINQAPGPKGDSKGPAEGPLGLEGDGGAGSDGFGLAGRGKGGRDITSIGGGGASGGGGNDMNTFFRKNAWYNHRVQDEIDKGVRRYLNENGGIPKGKMEALVKIGMDEGGSVSEHRILRSSGNNSMDDAIKRYLRQAKISEPPPRDIPKGEKGLTIMIVKIALPG